MSEIKFNEEDIERAIIAATEILENDILLLLRESKSIQACYLLERIVTSLTVCQSEMEQHVGKTTIAEFLIEWKFQLELLSQKMTEMKDSDIIYEVEILMATCRKNIEPETLFVV